MGQVARNRAQQTERDRKKRQFEKGQLKAARKEAAMNGLIQEERKASAQQDDRHQAKVAALAERSVRALRVAPVGRQQARIAIYIIAPPAVA